MMKWYSTFLTLAALLFITGCGKPVYIEAQQFVLIIGINLEDDNKLVIYTTNPVFRKEATDKYKITSTKTNTLLEGRNKIDVKTNGTLASGKLQIVLIGKKLLQHKDALPYLDIFFRDPLNDINASVIVVDGPVKDVIYANMSDKGRIGVVIKEMVDSSIKESTTVQTSLQQFHQQMLDKEITAYLTQMKVEENDLVISGTVLLHKDGTYAASLNNQESSLLLLLQRNLKNPIPLTFHFPPKMFDTDKEKSFVSFEINKTKYNIKTKFAGNRLKINIQMKVHVVLSERIFSLDMEKKSKQLEQAIEKELKKECEALIKKTQKQKTYPFGFGAYVKVQNYKKWKKVQDDWEKVMTDAAITVSPKVTIKNSGVSE